MDARLVGGAQLGPAARAAADRGELPELAAQLDLPAIRIAVPAGEWLPTLFDLSYDRRLPFRTHLSSEVDGDDWCDAGLAAARAAYDAIQQQQQQERRSCDDMKSPEMSEGATGGGGDGDGVGQETRRVKDGPSDVSEEGEEEKKKRAVHASAGSAEGKAEVRRPDRRAWRLACMEEARGSGSANPDHAFQYVARLSACCEVTAAVRSRFDAAVEMAQERRENQLGALRIFMCETIPAEREQMRGSPPTTLEKLRSAGLALA